MNIDQLTAGVIRHFGLVPTPGADFPPGLRKTREAKLWWDGPASALMLKQETKQGAIVCPVREEAPTSRALRDLCTMNLPRLAWITDVRRGPDGTRLLIQVHQFPREFPFPELSIAVDEKVIAQAGLFPRSVRDAAGLIAILAEQCLLRDEGAGPTRAFLSAGADPDAVDADPAAFVLHGLSVRVFVRRVRRTLRDGRQAEILLVDKVARGQGTAARHPVYLASGKIAFVDGTAAGQMRATAQAELAALLDADQSFLRTWERYGAMEEQYIARRVRAFGAASYSSFEFLPEGGVRFDLDDPAAEEKLAWLKPGEALETSETPPKLDDLFARDARRGGAEPGEAAGEPAPFVGSVVGTPKPASRSLVLQGDEADQAIPASGYLSLSIWGDRKRLERREKAQRAIREGRCPMPQLGLLLEGAEVAAGRYPQIQPLSPQVLAKVFTSKQGRISPPNPRQEEAIRLALNTPDIALIQGPPGTGKTTVIRAIVERLNELNDRTGRTTGAFLISGFQHDAVENAIARLDVNHLPAIKFGRRNRVDGFEEAEERIQQWREAAAAELARRFPEAERPPLQQRLRLLAQSYILAPGDLRQTIGLLDQALDLVRGHVPGPLREEAEALRRALAAEAAGADGEDARLLIRALHALRTDPTAFADDGPQTALRALGRLERQDALDDATRALLERAADWAGPGAPPFLEELEALRLKLLARHLPRGRSRQRPAVRRDVAIVLARFQDALEAHYRGSLSAPDAATAEFRDRLANNPEAVRRALIDYTAVFAATCQQSDSPQIARVQGLGAPAYETVLVDEAARSNPLDLFIPLTQARRRIILVGDHRQLPHIIDSEIERELEQAVVGADPSIVARTNEIIKQSLFQHLFSVMQRRERRDGIARTLTLNEQYRMHPALGEFVSRAFYPPDEQFGSGLPAEAFRHELPGYEGRAAAWLHVPVEGGPEEAGQSKSRRAEAVRLAAELGRLIRAPAAAGLTFGVITFYAAQVAAISRALADQGLMVAVDQDEYQIAEAYRAGERLRVGTVDAFQGKEFDVVFLSMVRSNRLPDDTEPERRRKYGHLMSPNRLCVSMSRQKRLLVVVGDAAMLRFPHAREAIPQLVAFHALAEDHRRRAGREVPP